MDKKSQLVAPNAERSARMTSTSLLSHPSVIRALARAGLRLVPANVRRAMRTPIPVVPKSAPSVPWLGVILAPAIMELDAEKLMGLADLERCIAWAILETEAPPARNENL